MTQYVWIASYPRSGNTWLRFLIGNLLVERIERSIDVATLIPGIHRFVTGQHLHGPKRSFIKTHWAWRSDFPLRGNTESVVYIQRHPLSVAESVLNYAARGGRHFAYEDADADIDRFARGFMADYIRFGGHSGWYRQGFGTWDENIASWTETALPFRRHIVRYEELQADPARVLTGIAQFLDLPSSPERIAASVANSSIDRLRALEDLELKTEAPGFFYNSQSARTAAAGFNFIGGDNRRQLALTDQERSLLSERFAPTMAKLGYD